MATWSRRGSRRAAGGRERRPALSTDDAFLAVLIGAVEASGHASADELARAHNVVWSTRRFRRRSGESVGRAIMRMRALMTEGDPAQILAAAARAVPARLRRAVFAIAADLVLVDGRLASGERRFLDRLAIDLRQARPFAKTVVDIMRVKNSA